MISILHKLILRPIWPLLFPLKNIEQWTFIKRSFIIFQHILFQSQLIKNMSMQSKSKSKRRLNIFLVVSLTYSNVKQLAKLTSYKTVILENKTPQDLQSSSLGSIDFNLSISAFRISIVWSLLLSKLQHVLSFLANWKTTFLINHN